MGEGVEGEIGIGVRVRVLSGRRGRQVIGSSCQAEPGSLNNGVSLFQIMAFPLTSYLSILE